MYKELIIAELSKVKRKGIKKLLSYLDLNGFYISPCSSTQHCNYEGGLAEHSWNVYVTFKDMLIKKNIKLSDDSIILVSILHDLCKIDMYEFDLEKEKYVAKSGLPLGHGEKSVIMIQKFISLTDEECCIIRWHMNKFDISYLGLKALTAAIELYPAVEIIHSADMLCALTEDKK
jgi:hypothetical protein